MAFVSKGDQDAILHWMITDPLEEGGLVIADLPYIRDMADEEKYAIARIAVYDGNGNRVTDAGEGIYLDVWGSDKFVSDGIILPDFNTGSWKSEEPVYADVSAYDASYSFMIELGIWGGEDEDVWMVLAHSESTSYSELYQAGHIDDGSITPPEEGPWSGGHYSVPEPSSGLLVLIGGALLALRRRRGVAR